MGSGSRFTCLFEPRSVGLGIAFTNFPFAFTIQLHLIVFHISLGLGKGYDK